MKKKGFDYLTAITAVDYVTRLEVLYLLYNTSSKQEEIVRVSLDTGLAPSNQAASGSAQKRLEIGTVTKIYPAADWFERELSEMFGIEITGRKAKRLLLEKWNGAETPLRKSFEWGKPYRKVD